ncbi:cytochrome c oxidase assembly protein [uncultured Arthrobacter sp.]|uniref:cytochrome c oxidase assembly protein n=1 Tax=uncultured Arthrobacter sp. TaxID=114050 RepID=UPI003216718B
MIMLSGGHTHDGGTADVAAALPLLLVILLAATYVVLALRQSQDPRGWNRWRTAAFLSGCALLALGYAPQLSPYPEDSLPAHMYQHLLIGMYAPLGLVLGAPVTLLLRSASRQHARLIGRTLRSRPLHLFGHPFSALTLNLGGLALLYFTPLYTAAANNPVLHHFIHLHFLAAGYLFAWVIAGTDPAPRRPTVPARLVYLGIAITAHAVLSQMIYAGALIQAPDTPAQYRQAGDLMYYGGDIAELLLAFALVTTWRRHPRRPPARQQMKAAT